MVSRFFVEDQLKAGTMHFDGSEFHHMVRVTRHQVGDNVRLFDGTGKEADAEITFISRHSATLKVGKVFVAPEEESPQLILAVALPKASRCGWLVEKAAELGVGYIQPIITSRSVVTPRDSKLETLRGNIVAACKQSGRSRLMEIKSAIPWADFVRDIIPNNVVAIAHPGGVPFVPSLVHGMISQAKRSRSKKNQKNVMIAIGPEGGFSVEEITQAVTHDAQLVGFGNRLLRIETATVFAASVFHAAQLEK